MKRILIILLFIPLFSFGQGYSGYYFKASQYLNSPVYKLSGVDLDSANTLKKGFFTKYQYNKLQNVKAKNDSILNSGFATNYKLKQKVSSQWTTSSSNIYFNSGSVGIGYASPSYTLHVKGGIDADSIFIGGAKLYAGDPNRWADFNHNIYTDWGFVGINKNNPTHWLDVAGGINADTILINNIPVVSSQWTSSGNQIFYGNGMVSMNDSAQVGEYLDVEGDYFQTLLSNNSHFTIFEDNRSDTIFTINKNKGIRFDPNNLGYKVGIGKNPTAAFEVSGSTLFHTNNSYGFCVFDDVNDGTALSANAVNKTILIDDQSNGYKVGIGITTVPTQALDVVGVIKASSYMMQQGIYAGIYVSDASTAQSIPNGTTYTKSTAFTTDGLSANCTSDAANDKITITKTGKYLVNGTCSFSSGTNNVLWRSAAFLGGVEQSNIHWKRKVSIAGDVGSAAFMGLINITSVPVDLDVRFRHDQAGSTNITVEYSNITVLYVGE